MPRWYGHYDGTSLKSLFSSFKRYSYRITYASHSRVYCDTPGDCIRGRTGVSSRLGHPEKWQRVAVPSGTLRIFPRDAIFSTDEGIKKSSVRLTPKPGNLEKHLYVVCNRISRRAQDRKAEQQKIAVGRKSTSQSWVCIQCLC